MDEPDEFFRDALGFGLFTRTTRRDAQNWEAMDNVSRESWRRRALGNLDFIPSEAQVTSREVAEVTVREIPEPEVRPREAMADEIPSSAKSVMKKLESHGWTVRVEYGKHSWPKQADKIEDAHGDVVEKVPYGIVESIVVKGRRGDQRMFAIWMTKPWTKDGDTYKFYTSHFIPHIGKVKSPEMKKLIESYELV